MRPWFAVAAVAVGCLGLIPTVQALVARPFPLPQKVAVSDAVVVGRVVALEERAVEVPQAPNAAKAAYTIANIKIDDGLGGTKGLTNIRVGFIPTTAGDPAGGRPIRRPGVVIPNLAAGQEGCFFLTRHPVGDFYVITPGAAPLDKKAENYAKELAAVRKFAKIMADAPAALSAADAKERLTAAGMLVQKYRAWRGSDKQEPIPAEESKKILTVLLESDWAVNDPDPVQSPLVLFNSLGLQLKDGFRPPVVQAGQDYTQVMQKAAKNWIKANLDTYRIQKYVAGK